jgi:hypothetical protein
MIGRRVSEARSHLIRHTFTTTQNAAETVAAATVQILTCCNFLPMHTNGACPMSFGENIRQEENAEERGKIK